MTKNLEVYPTTYNNLTFNDLIIFCRNCHRQLHRLENQHGGKNKWMKNKPINQQKEHGTDLER